MRIGILTFHRPANFGANLQAYSTTCYFKALGHEVKVIDYIRAGDLKYKDLVNLNQFYAHKYFVENRLPLTRQVMDESGLSEVVAEEKFELLLIGSDAVWRSPQDNNIYFAQWLYDSSPLRKIKVASISPAHMGDGYESLSINQRTAIRECLKRFNFITVRDVWTKYVINRDIFNGEDFIKIVNPDPVFSLYRFIENEIWDSKGISTKSYYLMSLPKQWTMTGKFSKKKRSWFDKFKRNVNNAGYKLIELPIPEGKSGLPFDYSIDYPIDPLQWFLWIRNAKAFCGLRFHAIVSSISNGTPFYSVDSYGDNSMYTKMLDMLGLHTLARSRDKNSKIYNLLEGSQFSKFRCGSDIEFESPSRLFKMLENMSSDDIIKFRDSKLRLFDKNMNEMLKIIAR